MRPLLCLALSLLLAQQASSQALKTFRVAEGIQHPTYLTTAPGDGERLFVIARKKGIYVVKNGEVLPERFLDLSEEVSENTQGVMGMAFHPDYQSNGRFFVIFTDKLQDSYISEFQVTANPDLADLASRVDILGPYPQIGQVHNWNHLVFGPDGMLYAGTGDGVLSSDDVSNYAQDLGSLFGKILRLDVDLPPPYVPADNPFVGQPGAREEVWHYGLRQPWRFCFDAETDDLYIGDVGHAVYEEVNFVPAGSPGGLNFGWRCIEGMGHCTGFSGCDCGSSTWVDAIHEFTHTEGRCAMIGGYVYRGDAMPALHGTYFFADHCTGRIWSFRYDGSSVTDLTERTAELAPEGGYTIDAITSFGVDNQGEMYICDLGGGEIFKITSDECSVESYCETSPNSFGPGALMGYIGAPTVTQNAFRLTVADAARNQFGIFFYGTDQAQVPFGDGYRCVAFPLHRLKPAVQADGSGDAEYAVDLEDPPQASGTITPGSTWNFQFWYRDPLAGGAGFNLSDGLSVTFCP